MTESITLSWKVRFLDRLAMFIFSAVFFGGGGLFLISVGTVVVQSLKYLKTGDWPHWTLIDVLANSLPIPFFKWLFDPKDWFGWHKIVSWIFFSCPISVIPFVLALVWFLVGVRILERLEVVVREAKDTPR